MQIGRLLIQGAASSSITTMKNWGDYFLGMACYQCNELDTARKSFNQIVNNRYNAVGAAYHDAITGLALIHQIHGEFSEAQEMVRSLSEFELEQRGNEDQQTRSLRARLQLLQGDLEGAGRWADSYIDSPPDQSLIWLEEPQVTRTRILVARGTEADLRHGLQILDVLDEIVERTHNTWYKIEVRALRALALDRQGETGRADAVLKQALDLASPGGFMRIFLDPGKPMQEMLLRLAKQDQFRRFIPRILAAFPEQDKNLVGIKSHTRQLSTGHSPLAEPLTPREFEVLELLRERLSIKEIAQKLSVSHGTAKRHTINLYGKLGVNRRWDAVAKAEELNLLPPD